MSAQADLRAMAGLAGVVEATTVTGIPTLLAPREGLVTGGLMFRVGRSDETLATAGITHLVEHLALYPQNLSDVHHNGQTARTYTLFHATGTPEDVVAFLDGVCAALRDLPLHRLPTEKEILRTEAARRNDHSSLDALSLWRYGLQGPGLLGSAEEGLTLVGPDDVADWARTWFTRDNAILFVTGATLPDGLDLTLPTGRRMPVATPDELLPNKPAWFRGPGGGVIVDALVPRSAPSMLFSRVAQRVLFRELRQEGGLSYTVDCGYEPVDADRARVSLFADALPEKEDAVVGGMVDALAAMRAGHIDRADLDAARTLLHKETTGPDRGAAMLPSLAYNLLVGSRIQHPDDLRAEQDAVTLDDVVAVAELVWDDALAQVPRVGLDWAGFTAAPLWSAAEVSGDAYPHLAEEGVALVLGPEGVSMRTPGGAVTVHYEDCVLMSAVPDGGRLLAGRDGFRIAVEPTLYRGLTPTIVAAEIDPRVPSHLVQHRSPRPEDQIPRVESPAAGRRFAFFPAWRGLGEWARTPGIFFIAVAIVIGLVAVAGTGTLASGGPGMTLGDVIGAWLWTIGLGAGGAFLVVGAARRRAIS